MNYRRGDVVMHCIHGLGKIVQAEERSVYGPAMLYYAVQIGDMTVWVPADDNLGTRLRPPTRGDDFQRLLNILNSPGDLLPDDRHERKELLTEWLSDGRAESLCRVIRGLFRYRQSHSLNDNDQIILRRTQRAFVDEWSHSLSITPAQAENELQHLLASTVAINRGLP